jgi:hypothetical protein
VNSADDLGGGLRGLPEGATVEEDALPVALSANLRREAKLLG